MWTLCRHQRASLISISRRSFTLHHLNKSDQRKVMLELVPYCDYSILKRKKNLFTEELHPYLRKVTTVGDYIRNVNDFHHSKKVRTFTRSKKNKFEAIFSIILHALHYACANTSAVPKSFLKLSHNLPQEVEYILKSTKSSQFLKQAHELDPNFQKEVAQLVNLYSYGDTKLSFDTRKIDQKLLKNIEISYAALLLQLDNRHEFQHLLQWISSIMAPTVTDCCQSLTGLSTFPNVVIKDVLLREPTSEYEFDLMFDLFQHYAEVNTVFSEVLIKNMIHFANRYKFTKLEELVQIILTKSSQSDDAMLNRLVCSLADLGEMKSSRNHYLSVLNAQRLIIDKILERKGEIAPLGYLGIARGLIPLSPQRAGKFLLFVLDQKLTTEESQLASIIKLKLSQSPDTLIRTFDSTMGDVTLEKSPDLWKELFINLEHFNLLNEQNSLGFLKKVETPQFSDAKNELLSHLDLNDILEKTITMNNRSLGIILDKLYRSKKHFHVFGEGYNYARHIFHYISSPSRSTVGVVLLGESFENPPQAYDLYLSLLEKHCDNIPNEKCLLSLLIPPYLDPTLKWGNRYASQIAVHEFRKHCKRSLDDVEGTIIPSNSLWKPYVKLLGRCNYQDELSEVMKLWEDLNVIPERETLAMLLASLPVGVGESKRRHAVKYLVPNEDSGQIQDLSETPNWDWPDDHELYFQREKIVQRF